MVTTDRPNRLEVRSDAFADYTRMPRDASGGAFVHWVVTGIPPTNTRLDPDTAAIPGTNGSGDIAWGGPHPPLGDDIHRYAFHLFATDRELGLREGATADEARAGLAGHVLASGSLIGLYVR